MGLGSSGSGFGELSPDVVWPWLDWGSLGRGMVLGIAEGNGLIEDVITAASLNPDRDNLRSAYCGMS